MSRPLILNAFLMANGHHEAAWRLPDADPDADFDLRHWTTLARIAEDATFDSLFLADTPGLWGDGQFRPAGQLEPVTLLAVLASVTERIGLVATASTTYNSPYNLARRFATLDHVSAGRAGWNLVTTAESRTARNFGLDARPSHAERYRRAQEFLDVTRKLWDSWADDAAVSDKARGRYADPSRIRTVDHAGDFYRVRGPLNVRRPPQGHPVLVQAGSSTDGRAFAARNAEAIFTAHQTRERAAAFYADIKAQARAAGRDPDAVKILPGIVPVLGSSAAEARALAQQLDELRVPEYGLHQLAEVLEVPADTLALDARLPRDVLEREHREGAQSRADLVVELAVREDLTVRELLSRLGGGRGHFTLVGTPEQVADTIESWFTGGAADGFNVKAPVLPAGLEAFAAHVLPILKRRGLWQDDYRGTTLREHYGLERPPNRYRDAHAPTATGAVREPVAAGG
jgi:FMN-dependent oxidoreductase (nitrilotriacetate monooxygenase family)